MGLTFLKESFLYGEPLCVHSVANHYLCLHSVYPRNRCVIPMKPIIICAYTVSVKGTVVCSQCSQSLFVLTQCLSKEPLCNTHEANHYLRLHSVYPRNRCVIPMKLIFVGFYTPFTGTASFFLTSSPMRTFLPRMPK